MSQHKCESESIHKPNTSAFGLPTASFSSLLSSHVLRGLTEEDGSKDIYSHIHFSAKLKSHYFSMTDQEQDASYGSKLRQNSNKKYAMTNINLEHYLNVKASLKPCFVDKIMLWYSPTNFTSILVSIFHWKASV